MGQVLKRQVPELSLLSYVNGNSQQRQVFFQELFRGIVDYGFIILKDHTVDQKLVDRSYQVVHDFFSLPENEKLKYVSTRSGNQRGYTPFGKERAKGYDVPDLKEFWHLGRELPPGHHFAQYYPDNIWPVELPEFQKNLTELYRELDKTANHLLEALSFGLDVSQNFFKEMTDLGNSILRLIHYPPVQNDQVKAGSIRAQAHGDINLITLLVGATSSGLQLLDRDGTWLDVATRPGEIVVDAGDMMSRLTNEVIPSTVHRVVNPAEDNYQSHRYSMPFFVHPHPEAMLSCLPSCRGVGEKFPAIRSHDFLMERLRDIGLMS